MCRATSRGHQGAVVAVWGTRMKSMDQADTQYIETKKKLGLKGRGNRSIDQAWEDSGGWGRLHRWNLGTCVSQGNKIPAS